VGEEGVGRGKSQDPRRDKAEPVPPERGATIPSLIRAALAAGPKVVAIGECGLDYFRLSARLHSRGQAQASGGTDKKEKKRQADIFTRQIELAIKLDKPLMIHGRPSKGRMDAYRDILGILRSYKNKPRLSGNVHFFSGNKEIAREFLDLGFTLSFTGVITFTSDYDEMVKYVPLDYVLSETDCPYAAPLPHRGKRNEPSFVFLVAGRISDIRKGDKNVVLQALVNNARRVFRLE